MLARIMSVPKVLRLAIKWNSSMAEDTKYLLGLLNVDRIRRLENVTSLCQVEFGVYSQWGEDGIIEYLISQIESPVESFVEFGVRDYRESNTRFLLKHRNWRGLVLDGSERDVDYIRNDPISWRHELHAHRVFVTVENINRTMTGAEFRGEIGLLSIDIDGNDYWVWKAISVVNPQIVVVEYNALFGGEKSLTVPYDPAFDRGKYHYSHLCFGASLRALVDLGKKKGYAFVGTNTNGVNAFFVRSDLLTEPLKRLAETAHFSVSRVRESRDRGGNLSHVSGESRLSLIADCLVVDMEKGETATVNSLIRGFPGLRT